MKSHKKLSSGKLTAGSQQRACYGSLVEKFGYLMQREISANQHKGDWNQWHPEADEIYREIHHHMSKLSVAISMKRKKIISEFAADLANFYMKIHEEFGEP